MPRLPRPPGAFPLCFAASPHQEATWGALPHAGRPPVVQGTVRLTGPLDTAALRRAWRAVEARHEVLRSGYREDGGRLTQVVAAPGDLPVPLSAAEVRPAGSAAALRAERERPFDLVRGPLARLLLLRAAPGEHLVVFTLHELIADTAALGLLAGELAAAYRGAAPDRPAAQYADLAAVQRQRNAEGRGDESTEYWLRRLNGAEPAVLPWDLADPAGPAFTPGPARSLSFPLPVELYERVAEAARRHRTGVQVVGLTAFHLLLACWSGQRDISVRGPVPDRVRPADPPLLAPLSRAVVLRADLSGAPAFGELVDQVRLTSAWDFAHRDIPLEPVAAQLGRPRLVEELGGAEFGSGGLVDAGPAWGRASWGGRLTAEPFTGVPLPARRPLSFRLLHDERSARCVVTYDTAVFSEARVRQLRADYFGLLTDLAAHPRARFH
ncbi:condensation domain-containing protein [Streptomyces sp. NPDC012888]|uniref:condensation domain-containing protein n=1 Tax=Streptomyces sp. NPDC012888 TaxID=3364855 RepID=UPI00367600EE